MSEQRAVLRVQIDWSHCRVVIFDVDGTLYDQRKLRARMGLVMAREAFRTRDLNFVRVLRMFRHLREKLAEEERDGFEALLVVATAQACSCSEHVVREVVADWIERRPLSLLRALVFPHTAALFDAIRASGRRTAVLSDYPADDKLEAMGLKADIVISASDPEVGVLKPNPRGLQHIMRTAGVSSEECLFIGDRFERDGEAAARANMPVLIRSRQMHAKYTTFRSYADPVHFGPFLNGNWA